jgi:hydrogenase expression/formation protein HypD
MKYVDEYRDSDLARQYLNEIAGIAQQKWTIMEVCGGQTHTIIRTGIDQMLPANVTLLHGPGCPVCVTPAEYIDKAIEIARQEDVILCSFGDILRVPGSAGDLFSAKAEGGDIRVVYSPLDSLALACENPERQVVFFAIGFETTAPTTALALKQAKHLRLTNYSMLVAHFLIPPAMEAILADPACGVQGFIAAGHVCTVTGFVDYEQIAARYATPFVVTGFETLDILQGIHMLILQLENGTAEVQNQYSRVVRRDGNPHARSVISEVFRVTDRNWRGIGQIANSGLALADSFADYDAEKRFELRNCVGKERTDCISGSILQGKSKPHQCPSFAHDCTPEHPLGATMVSSEGACAAYYRWGRQIKSEQSGEKR